MRRIQYTYLSIFILMCLLFTTACGSSSENKHSDRRIIEIDQLYDHEIGTFLLDGYSPGTKREELAGTAGFLQHEPVVFHGFAANVIYTFEQDLLYKVSYEFSVKEMTKVQWTEAVTELYEDLRGAYDWLPTYKLGTPSDASFSCLWYAAGIDRMSMLKFAANPSKDSANTSDSTIIITIVTDLSDNGPAISSYRAHFQPANDEMVKVSDWIPFLFVDLMYAKSDNFTGQVIYDFSSAYLRYGTIKKLIDVQKKLNQQGYSLKICDAFRPVSAQYKLWEIVPDSNFVVDPYHGYSNHSRGNTVDVTLVTIDGDPVEMPTEVDTFSPLADRDYSDVSKMAARNATLLQNIMIDAGFKPNSKEWWHYCDTVSYPVAKDFVPVD
jgi:zinc D-Ala-D-Ala dipeptidase